MDKIAIRNSIVVPVHYGNDIGIRFKKVLNNILSQSKCMDMNTELYYNTEEKNSISSYSNIIFYLIKIDDIANDEMLSDLDSYMNAITRPRQHMFIIVDGCDMKLDDENELILINRKQARRFDNFADKRDNMSCSIIRTSLHLSEIYSDIISTGSIKNIPTEGLDLISLKLLEKKYNNSKKELVTALSKTDLELKLCETGHDYLVQKITRHLRPTKQRTIVCENYIHVLEHANDSMDQEVLIWLDDLINKVHTISFLKGTMMEEFLERFNEVLKSKVISLLKTIIDHGKMQECRRSLQKLCNSAEKFNITEVKTILSDEIRKASIRYDDLEKTSDIDKIIDILGACDDNSEFNKLFNNNKLITENINNNEKVCHFIDSCIEFKIPKEIVLRFIGEFVLHKIMANIDMSRSTNESIGIIYPQCLQVFLLENLQKHFIFKKIYMYLSHTIKYSGRNISDIIKNIEEDQYNKLLCVEMKMIQLCS